MVKRLVAIGDSVVWGQGNRTKDKFVTLVSRTLGLGDPVLVAHSGACIKPNDATTADYAEVPLGSLGIPEQVDQAVKMVANVGQVAIVLLNGGINDVPAMQILTDGEEDLTRRINSAFAKFPALLERTVNAFPTAKVVALGYYPIISKATPAEVRLEALVRMGPPDVAARVAAQIEEAGVSESDLANELAPELASMENGSTLFAELANSAIQKAVAQWQGRAVYAMPEWRPEYSLGLSTKTWLWLGINDPVFGQRANRFFRHVRAGKFDWPVTTLVASMGHPNVAGSKGYAAAIDRAMRVGVRATRGVARRPRG